MEKYIDALKLGAKRKQEEPVGLHKRKMKQPKKPKITAEEYIEKVKSKAGKRVGKRTVKPIKPLKLKELRNKLLEEEIKKATIAKLKKQKLEEEKKKQKLFTQSETQKEQERVEKEKESEKAEKLKAKPVKETVAPLTLLSADPIFKQQSKEAQDEVKKELKKFNKKAQLEKVQKYLESPKAQKESFLLNFLPEAPAPKGAITDFIEELSQRQAPGKSAGIVGADVSKLPTLEEVSKKEKKKQKLEVEPKVEPKVEPDEEVINKIVFYINQYPEEERAYLEYRWDLSLNQDPQAFISTEDIEYQTDSYSFAFNNLPADQKAKFQKAVAPDLNVDDGILDAGLKLTADAEEEALRKAVALSGQQALLPDSAIANIDKSNALAIDKGLQPTILTAPTLASAPAPAPAPTKPKILSKSDIKQELENIYTKTELNNKIKELFPTKKSISKLNATEIKQLKDAMEQQSVPTPAPAPKAALSTTQQDEEDEAELNTLVQSSLIPTSLQLAQIPAEEQLDVGITPSQVASTVAQSATNISPDSSVATATAEGFASGLKKVKKMHGKKIHDKVVRVMAISNALKRGLDKVKKMHGGSMHDKVKSILMKRGGDIDVHTPRDNTYLFFNDYSDFVQSKLYKDNKAIITKYPPENKYFQHVPQYKQYRIVLRNTGTNLQDNKIVYTIDANKDNYDNIVKRLISMGAITAQKEGQIRKSRAEAEISQKVKQENEAYKTGMQEGYSRAQSGESSMSPGEALLQGFSLPVSLFKDIF